MLSLLSDLTSELEGVKYSDDIEYIHRARVATRRLRAAMPLFEECFTPEDFRRWKKSIKEVTSALGDARDKDVQINLLKGFLVNESPDSGPVFFAIGAGADKTEPGKSSETEIIPVYSEDVSVEPDTVRRPFFERIIVFIRRVLPSGKEETEYDTDTGDKPVPVHEPQPENSLTTGIECLITRLGQKREALQPGVVKSVGAFEKSKTIDRMGDYLRKIKISSDLDRTDIHSPYSYQKAFYNISLAIENIFWYEKFLPDPDQVSRHHEMRISGKALRYILETYAGLYPGELKSRLKVMKKIQDYLGDIHDCDVWADFIDEFIEEERKRTILFFGNDSFFDFVLPGLLFLKKDRINKRKELHSEFAEYWETLKKEHFWDDLRSDISIPLQSSFHHLIESSDEDKTLHIALIGDVHANLPALEAVLEDASERGASAVINTGDLVGYGAFPDQVVSKIRSGHILSVIGNYDLNVLNLKKKKKSLPKNRQKRLAMKWAAKEISSDNRKYLRSLPGHLNLNLKKNSIYITHGSPDSIKEYIGEDTTDEKLQGFIKKTGANFIVTGHSHVPFAKEIDGTWFINTGSVGRPDDGDPRACYAMLSLNPFSLYHVRVPYDIEKAVDEIYKKNLPESFARIFREGKPLDIIMHSDEYESQ